MPASVLRTNKRVAAEARETKTTAPDPPQRSTSIRSSARINLSGKGARHSSDDDSTKGKDSDQETTKPQTTMTRPRRSAPLSNSGAHSRDAQKVDSKVGKLMSKFSGKGKEEEDHASLHRSAKARYSLRETSSLYGRPSSVRGSSARDSDSDTEFSSSRGKKSPSFIKKIIDKSSSRKSVLNRPEMMPASPLSDRKARVSVLKTTTKSSRC